MSNKYVVVSGAVFGLVALGQVVRAFEEVPVHLGSQVVLGRTTALP